MAAVWEKTGDFFILSIGRRKKGRVAPREKKNIISKPERGLPEERARDWLVKVNPQGIKKVSPPKMKGEDLVNFGGRWKSKFGRKEKPSIFIEFKMRMMEIIMINTEK